MRSTVLDIIACALGVVFWVTGSALLTGEAVVEASAVCSDTTVAVQKGVACDVTPESNYCTTRCVTPGGWLPCSTETRPIEVDLCPAAPPSGTPGELCGRPDSCGYLDEVTCTIKGFCTQSSKSCGGDDIWCDEVGQWYSGEMMCDIEFGNPCPS